MRQKIQSRLKVMLHYKQLCELNRKSMGYLILPVILFERYLI